MYSSILLSCLILTLSLSISIPRISASIATTTTATVGSCSSSTSSSTSTSTTAGSSYLSFLHRHHHHHHHHRGDHSHRYHHRHHHHHHHYNRIASYRRLAQDYMTNFTSTCNATMMGLSNVLTLQGGAIPSSFTLPTLSFPLTKFLLQVTLTALNVLCWSIPLRSKHLKANKHLLSLANSFAGGIFLMLSFSHLIPEAIDSFATSSGNGYQAVYYVLFGFMAMLFVEKVAFDADHHNLSDSEEEVVTPPPISIATVSLDSLDGKTTTTSPVLTTPSNKTTSSFKLNSAIILCLAMSIHSFFEAAALGLSRDHMAAYLMTACIGLHQPAESIALVVAFLKSNMPQQRVILWLSAFSCVALFGSLAGIAVDALATQTMEAIIVAVTAGTFIYVGATEIVSEEFEEGDFTAKMQKFLAYIGGMVSMYLITGTTAAMEKHL